MANLTKRLDERDWKEWLRCALIRAIKTFAQSSLAMITVGTAITEINWAAVLGVSGTAALLSILTSVVGIPEADE